MEAERERLGIAPAKRYDVQHWNRHPVQRDSISCAAYACFYAYMFGVHGRLPLQGGAEAATDATMRTFLFDAVINGAGRRPLVGDLLLPRYEFYEATDARSQLHYNPAEDNEACISSYAEFMRA